MVLFDYGQTLIAEQKFDGVKGTEAVLQYAARNKYHLSAEQVLAKANEIKQEFGRSDAEKRHLFQIEIPNEHVFNTNFTLWRSLRRGY